MAVSPLFNIPLDGGPTPLPGMSSAPKASVNGGQDDPEAGWKRRHSGVAGGVRDVLGTLGDFLLTKLGMPAMYSESKRQHELSAASQGWNSDDPAQALAAIDKVSQVDFGLGAKLRDQYIDNQRLKAAQESTAEARDARLALAQDAANQRTRGYAASMLGTMAGWDEDKRKQYYPQMREQVVNAAKRQGLDITGEIPEQYDPVALDAFIDGAVPVGTQRAQRLTQEKQVETADYHGKVLDQGQQKIDERVRNDKAKESLGAARVAISAQRAARSGGGGSSRPAPRPRPTGDDITYLRQHPEVRDKFDGRFGVGLSKRILGN